MTSTPTEPGAPTLSYAAAAPAPTGQDVPNIKPLRFRKTDLTDEQLAALIKDSPTLALIDASPKGDDEAARLSVPAPKVRMPADVMEARAQGRAEALAIILGLDAEVGLDEYTESIPPGPAGEWGTAWNEDKLRELFRADDSAWSLLQEAEDEYWHNLGLREEAERMHQRVRAEQRAVPEDVRRDAESIERRLTAAMREADSIFQRVGGSTRHHVRDCLLPILGKHGLAITAIDTAMAAQPQGEEVR